MAPAMLRGARAPLKPTHGLAMVDVVAAGLARLIVALVGLVDPRPATGMSGFRDSVGEWKTTKWR